MVFQDIRTFRNDKTQPFTVWLEPLAIDFVVLPGQELRIVGTSAKDGRFDVAEYGTTIGVYCWVGARADVYRDGELVDEVPVWSEEEPPGDLSVRQFIEGAFGGPGGPNNAALPTATKPGPIQRLWRWCKAWT
jgi:hypothetical protein